MSISISEFRAELEKIMPGYAWTVHKPFKSHLPPKFAEDLPEVLRATGIQSSGFNRLSTLEVTRREHEGVVTYEARSSGYGTKAPWLHDASAGTLARALRYLQEHYERTAATYRSHAVAIATGRKAKP